MHKARVLANYYYWNKLFAKINKEKIENGEPLLTDSFKLNLSEEDIEFITEGKGIPTWEVI